MSYLDAEYGGIGGFDYDSWGYYIGPGLRARWGRLEGYAKLLYIEREGVFGPYGAAQEGWVLQPGLLCGDGSRSQGRCNGGRQGADLEYGFVLHVRP